MGFDQSGKLIIDYGHCTHPGGKQENQDCCDATLDARGDRYCFVIADGVGSYRRGKKAAELAVQSILSSFARFDGERSDEWLHEALQEAHRLIKERSREDPSLGKMKSTCAVVVIVHGKAHWASVGDSRIYVFRNGARLHRSKDHSVVQVLLDMGEIKPEEVSSHPDRNRILRVLGMDEAMKPQVTAEGLALQRGDSVLLCTDGFWGLIPEHTVLHIVSGNLESRAQDVIESLFDHITSALGPNLYAKGHDNLTAQLILVK